MTAPHGTRPAAALALVLFLAPAGDARAERWMLSAEVPAALPVSAPQDSWFGPGGMPSVSLYRELVPALLVGGKLRAGILSDGPPPMDELADPGAGGLLGASLGLRVRTRPAGRRAAGGWIEAAVGGAVTGQLARPTFELGGGWGFPLGAISVGPSLRYLHIHQPADALSGADARLLLVGVEVGFLGRGDRASASLVEPPVLAPPPRRAAAPPAPVVDQVAAAPVDSDGDGVLDVDDACPTEPEVHNGVDDHDGCPDAGDFEVIDDRIVLDERVLFDTDRARVSRRGRAVLAAIHAYWAARPEFTAMTIEGHSDARGPEAYNQWLSEERARRVAAALVALGAPADRLEVRGLGETAPRVSGDDEAAWQANRRVEFLLVRRGAEVSR
jgi:outer membrane protein OmpA-like peptidoglycan-associated protein